MPETHKDKRMLTSAEEENAKSDFYIFSGGAILVFCIVATIAGIVYAVSGHNDFSSDAGSALGLGSVLALGVHIGFRHGFNTYKRAAAQVQDGGE